METLETALTWVLQWPLEVWSEQSWDDEQTRVMCRACRRICSEALQEGRKRVWERLPEIFMLPSWKSMEELMEKENL
ncbi:hypothetical protein CPB84DRAFT_1771121 [Gymnopilus junonius]|uniref:Uncharacterized protein n=1 Tax=Gymnopilus junonius TaxID=109634 RepID=A0A9P5NTD2_GYMJU|nr:hypothetical protein CPB84DRAFT_1771121 [Gymnopilus junonius]